MKMKCSVTSQTIGNKMKNINPDDMEAATAYVAIEVE